MKSPKLRLLHGFLLHRIPIYLLPDIGQKGYDGVLCHKLCDVLAALSLQPLLIACKPFGNALPTAQERAHTWLSPTWLQGRKIPSCLSCDCSSTSCLLLCSVSPDTNLITTSWGAKSLEESRHMQVPGRVSQLSEVSETQV